MLVGGSGSGKTTTLRLVNRLIEPTSGSVWIDGVDTRTEPAPLLRRRIGYCFQQVGLFPHLSVAENVAITPTLLGWSATRDRRARRRAARARRARPGRSTATGGRTRSRAARRSAWVSRARSPRARCSCCSTSRSARSIRSRARISSRRSRAIRRELGLTAIFVTHDMAEALLLGDRIAVLHAGRLVQVGTPSELLRAPADDRVAELLRTPRRQAEALDALLGRTPDS